jgi:transposase-like protein
MSWKESDRVSERLEFVRLASVEGANVSLLCERFSVSRKTGYKWLKRWRCEGKAGLEDRSRRPKRSPGQTRPEIPSNVESGSPSRTQLGQLARRSKSV